MKIIRLLIPALLVVMLLAVLPVSVTANPGLRVANAILVADVSPGGTVLHKMTVSLAAADSPMDLVVEVADIEHIESTYSARGFVTVDKASFHLEPGQSQEVTATVRIPSDVGNGGRYAMVIIRQKTTGTGVAIAVAVNVGVYLTIKDSQLIHKGKATEVSAGKAVSGQPVDIFTTFKNTGNHHFKVKQEVTISDARGEVLDTIDAPLSPSSIIPSLSERLQVSFIPKAQLPLGVYSIRARVMLEDGTILGEANGSFQVEKPYVPPPAPAKKTISAGSAATLQTADGAIVVSFPQGALISEAEVSLRSYPREQIPAAPAGFELTTTCFRIDGLTGLLAKEATVTVKYTDTDQEKASGDVSRLRLARWDEANKQWTVLKTRADKGATTLSTTTNQFSIWAVMVAPPGGVNWGLVGGVAVGAIIVALAGYFVVVRRRSY